MYFSILRRVAGTVFVLLYPYLVFRGIQMDAGWFAPLIIVTVLLIQAVQEPNPATKQKKFLIGIVLILGIGFFQSLTAKLLPTLIQIALMTVFYKTLRKGPPLIERFVRLEFPEFPAEIVLYCRQLTIIWTIFFAFNAVMCSILAFMENTFWWTLYSGVIIFLLTIALMVGEYIYRHYRFPGMGIPDIKTSAVNLIKNTRKIWTDIYAE